MCSYCFASRQDLSEGDRSLLGNRITTWLACIVIAGFVKSNFTRTSQRLTTFEHKFLIKYDLWE